VAQDLPWKKIIAALTGLLFTLLVIYLLDILPNKWSGTIVAAYCFVAAAIILGDLKRSLFFLLILSMPLDQGLLLPAGYQRGIANGGIFLTMVDISILGLISLWVFDRKTFNVTGDEGINWDPQLTKPAMCFLGANILSLLVSGDKTWCVYGIVNVIKLFALFFVVANSIKTEREIRYVMLFLVMGLFIQGSMYLIQHYTQSDFNVLGQSQRSGEFSGETRERGLMGQANVSGNFFAACLVLSISFYFIQRKTLSKVLIGIAIGLGVCALIITLTRIAWLSLIVSGMILMMIGLKRKWLKFRSVIPVLVILIMVVIGFWNSIAERFERDDKGSAHSRVPTIILMTRIIRDHPVLGVGVNNYRDAWEGYLTEDVREALSSGHNLYLLIFVETGLLGFLSFMWLLYAILKKGISTIGSRDFLKSKLAAGASMSIVSICIANLTNGNVTGPLANLMWFLAGVVSAIGRVLEKEVR
jgi:putative inorganic carbon (HCO3(-)) transporter